MMAVLSKLLNISHEDVFTINKDKGFLVDQRMTRKMQWKRKMRKWQKRNS